MAAVGPISARTSMVIGRAEGDDDGEAMGQRHSHNMRTSMVVADPNPSVGDQAMGPRLSNMRTSAVVTPMGDAEEEVAPKLSSMRTSAVPAGQEEGVLPKPSSNMRTAAVLAPPLDEEAAPANDVKKNREAIIQGLVNGRLEWSGTFKVDFWFYLRQTHMLLGMFLCHPLHPYNRAKRAFVFFCNLIGGFGVSCILSLRGQNSGLGTLLGMWLLSVVLSVLLTVADALMVTLLTCACLSEGTCLRRVLDCIRGQALVDAAESTAKTIALMVAGLCAVIFAIGLGLAVPSGVDLGQVYKCWLLAEVWTWVLRVLLALGAFAVGWYGVPSVPCLPGQAGPNGYKDPRAYPYGPRYPTDQQLLWGKGQAPAQERRPVEGE